MCHTVVYIHVEYEAITTPMNMIFGIEGENPKIHTAGKRLSLIATKKLPLSLSLATVYICMDMKQRL